MTLRALCVVVLAPLLSIALAAAPASADVRVGSVYKNSATKRLGPVVTGPSAPRTAPAPSPTDLYRSQVLSLTNKERTSRGLRPLAPSACATRFAQALSGRLATLGSLVHQAMRPILTTCAASSVGENIAYGSVPPAALVDMWMNSPGHRANILKPGFTHLGVGVTITSSGRVYAAQDFLGL